MKGWSIFQLKINHNVARNHIVADLTLWYSEFSFIFHNWFEKFGQINEFGRLSKSTCSLFDQFIHKIDGG